jgi:ABC-2 type transport system permease protein
MRASGLIAAKDFRLRFRDRSAFVVGVIAPLGLAFIFNLVLGDIADGDFVPVFAVTNNDQGAISSGFVAVLDRIDAEASIELAEHPTTEAGAETLVEEGAVSAAIIIPDGFTDAVQAGTPATITVIASPDAPVSAEIARSIAKGFTSEIRATQVAVATAIATSDGAPTPEQIDELVQAASQGLPEAVAVGVVETNIRELDLATFFSASMSVFFLFFTVSFGVNGLLEETQRGTMQRLLAAPIRPSTIVMGKAIVGFVLGVVSMTILIVASSVLLQADWGNPVGVFLLVVAGVLAATGLMMVVAAYAKTPEQAGNLMAILAVGLGMLGGIFFPGSLGTGVLSYVAYISPHRWFLLGLSDLAGGQGLSVIVPSLLGLVAFAAISWAFAMARFRRKGLAT